MCGAQSGDLSGQGARTPDAAAACLRRQARGLGVGLVVQPVVMNDLSKFVVLEHGFLPLATSA
ncbi:MAG: hypothetical protein ACYC1P_11920 [Gaiellaceae bacterium]